MTDQTTDKSQGVPGHPGMRRASHPDLVPKPKPAKRPEVPMPPAVMRSGGGRR